MANERTRLPEQVASHFKEHREALAAIAAGEDRTDDAVHAADDTLRAAWNHAADNDTAPAWSLTFTASFNQIVGSRLAAVRNEAGWSQARLAESMEPYARWTRFTVAEIETGRRSVALEELVLIAALFAEPAVNFLFPDDDTELELDTTNVAAYVLAELLIGKGGKIGNGGTGWTAAARVASEPGQRPAPDLWRNRSESRRLTRTSGSGAPGSTPKKGKK